LVIRGLAFIPSLEATFSTAKSSESKIASFPSASIERHRASTLRSALDMLLSPVFLAASFTRLKASGVACSTFSLETSMRDLVLGHLDYRGVLGLSNFSLWE